jgi:C4-type Zn-finger protein
MPLNFDVNDTCPKCGSTIRLAVIYLHPTDRDAAIHSLKCADCGYEKTKLLSLRPAAPPPELTARPWKRFVTQKKRPQLGS